MSFRRELRRQKRREKEVLPHSWAWGPSTENWDPNDWESTEEIFTDKRWNWAKGNHA